MTINNTTTKGYVQAFSLLKTATTTVASDPQNISGNLLKSFQAVGTTTSGAGAAEILIEGSNDGVNFIELSKLTLTLSTTPDIDASAINVPYFLVRARVSAISGTGASVNVIMGNTI